MVLPVGDEQQVLRRIQRSGDDYIDDMIEPVRFVPLIQGDLA